MPKHKGDALLDIKIRQPLPREDAFHRNDKVFPIGCNDLEEQSRVGFHVLVQHGFPCLIENADIHGMCM
jgi:hypothetical protein